MEHAVIDTLYLETKYQSSLLSTPENKIKKVSSSLGLSPALEVYETSRFLTPLRRKGQRNLFSEPSIISQNIENSGDTPIEALVFSETDRWSINSQPTMTMTGEATTLQEQEWCTITRCNENKFSHFYQIKPDISIDSMVIKNVPTKSTHNLIRLPNKIKSDNYIDLIDFMINKMESKKWDMYIKKHFNINDENDDDDGKYNIKNFRYDDEDSDLVESISNEENIDKDTKLPGDSFSSDCQDEEDNDENCHNLKDIYIEEDDQTSIKFMNIIKNVSQVFLNNYKNKDEIPEELEYFKNLVISPEIIYKNKYFKNEDKHNETFFMDTKKMIIENSKIWSPLRGRFIFKIPSSNYNFWETLAKQNYRCPGCGFYFSKIYAKRAQYCNYYELLFCQCCFQGMQLSIPGNILNNWNFKLLSVSDHAFNFLMKNKHLPVFDIKIINEKLYNKVKRLRQMKDLRYQLIHLWEYVKICSIAKKEESPYGELDTVLKEIPERFLEPNIDLYALSDFGKIASKQLILYYRPIVYFIRKHVENCFHCRERAFFCEFCRDNTEYLFPFQVEKIARCTKCGGLFHLKCYENKLLNDGIFECPKCKRIENRHELLENSYNCS
ncbi:Zinc finger, RING-type domain and Zinc finger, PHD-type domain and Zinc finger, RING/FYVE/PHD-type domain and Zinc finger, PHD-finger domain and Domain of unknown function DUF4206 domain-containing protein [Strongyloides ratti]|uniref:Rubicon Homology domain-containing protein n=1 Tax=Strongyloides ratti TaxID=34506 RepID=A0A090LKG7_STRRB|nr:Zinc finger, RING-type domain and Zinc finger, PHD-type domain and Zinc finger, RING/FYVE/PHD-type domain and Zinc finger, PHD-finger domain and Domain of unknown function DUF4206 domain-containing protein [Strongyloides ratti]CEF70297.1 Zinc finger, RING-type domain and Zinc finger, PHD-type domain and Zinc finger, RING/FYVE/PHD-type domain and Zinc finger, PHD-finger domain and Domain of unknown function DUF4206 domain-containing protein [Strongyloides ratti]